MVNKVILLGNVGVEPDVRIVDGGIKTATLRIATSERYKTQDGQVKENTEWHTVVLWRNLADLADKWVKKGDKVYVEGSLHTREWTDKNDVKHFTTNITGKELKLLSPKEKEQSAPQEQAQPQAVSPLPPMPKATDEIPF